MEALLNDWLWQEKYWLPPGIRWRDIEIKEEDGHLPVPRDLIYTLPLAVAFIALRYVFERLIAVPFSKYLGVKDRIRIRATSIPKLEAFYKQNSRQPSQVCISFCLSIFCRSLKKSLFVSTRYPPQSPAIITLHMQQ